VNVEKVETAPVDEPVFPSARINCNMVVLKNNLYIYGGVFEQGDREVSLNDLHRLNLHKLDGFDVLIQASIPEWLGEESDDEDDEEGEDGEDGEGGEENDDSGDEADSENESDSEKEKEKEKQKKSKMAEKSKGRKGKLEEMKAELDRFQKDGKPTPNTGESLKDFVERTNDFWTKFAFDTKLQELSIVRDDDKSLRKTGFQFAEERFKELRPLLKEFELIEEESKQEAAEKEARKKQKNKDQKDKSRK